VDDFTDDRSEDAIELTAEELQRQRVMRNAPGYEDLKDPEQLRYDSLLALIGSRSHFTDQAGSSRSSC